MTTPLADYRFLSWVRRGIAAELGTAAGALPARAAVQTDINLQGTPIAGGSPTALGVTTPAALYGPGDLVGIDRHHIVRTEPADGTANFEPDFFAGIEFDQPDFPWLFTPAGAGGDRLSPWVVLIALAADEFDPVKDLAGPLPAIHVHDITTLPDLSESWAWAHGQIAIDVKDQTVDAAELLRKHPELAASRILCPRHLRAETSYTAFLVPGFDAGVAAGLGQPSTNTTLAPAWTAQSPAPLLLPVYFQFSFYTSDQGDFESLVRRMQQRVLPKTVGLRDMDVAHLDLGWGVGAASPNALGMGGALRARDTVDTQWPQGDPRGPAFQTELTTLLNLTGPGTDDPNAPAPDPRIVPPLYGRWLAAQTQVPAAGWMHDLNLDPRRRAAAGLGTHVIIQERAQLIASARTQLEGVDKANQLLRQAQLVRSTLVQLLQKHFITAPAETVLAFTASVHSRVLGSARTIRAKLAESRLPLTALSAAFRRVARPLGPIRRRQGATDASPHGVIKRLNDGEISAAPPFVPPAGMTSIDQVADGLYPAWAPGWLRPLLRFLPLIVLIVALLLAGLLLLLGTAGGWLPLAVSLAILILGFAVWLATRLRGIAARARLAGQMHFDDLRPQAIATTRQRPDYQVTTPGTSQPPSPPAGSTDSPDARAFRFAATRVTAGLHAPAPNPDPPPPAEIERMRDTLLARLDPNVTVPARVATMVTLAPTLTWTPADPLAPIMAAPSFPQPMYVPLRDSSQEWLLPNIKEVPPDTMALIKADHAFIEAYMLGLNQEMGRQLLWNKYPTDQRGTYFRQCFDVSSYVRTPDDPPAGSEELRQKLYDIPPITSWPLPSPLGQHDNRGTAPDALILLLRGELLRRYPNAVIAACPAIEGDPNKNEPALVLDPNGPELYPLFRGTLPPDLTFFGFALTADQALGDAVHPKGWFFVFQQVPGEPRFGFEPSRPLPPSPIRQWAELSWANFGNGTGLGPAFASPATTPFNLAATGAPTTTPVSQTIQVEQDPDGTPLNPNDVITKNNWGTDAAQIAYITMRLPARVAVPAALMLPPR